MDIHEKKPGCPTKAETKKMLTDLGKEGDRAAAAAKIQGRDEESKSKRGYRFFIMQDAQSAISLSTVGIKSSTGFLREGRRSEAFLSSTITLKVFRSHRVHLEMWP
jgi:hypothetical protein